MLFRLLVVAILASVAVGLGVGWWLRSRRLAVRVLAGIGGGLAAACAIWVLVVALFLVALFEPWPVGLRQGPDTTFSRACYEEFLGGPLAVDVTRVYCRKEWGFGGDLPFDLCLLTFAF